MNISYLEDHQVWDFFPTPFGLRCLRPLIYLCVWCITENMSAYAHARNEDDDRPGLSWPLCPLLDTYK